MDIHALNSLLRSLTLLLLAIDIVIWLMFEFSSSHFQNILLYGIK